jgi:hypothetical protein
MATALSLISDWLDSEEKEAYFLTHRPLALRWINEGQARYADKSEVLRTTWSPSITSSGVIALPSDFLREFPDRVKKSSTEATALLKLPYQDAQFSDFTGVCAYSIFGSNFYVWQTTSCSPIVPYIKTPALIGLSGLDSASLEITTPSFAQNLLIYLDAMWSRVKGDTASYMALLAKFDYQCVQDSIEYQRRNDAVPTMRSGRFV